MIIVTHTSPDKAKVVYPFPRVENTSTGTIHYVYASGSKDDGSLYSQYTLCGRQIGMFNWQEVDGAATCGICLKTERAGRDYRNLNALRSAVVWLLTDADCCPGAYIHVNLDGLRAALKRAQFED